MAWDDVKKAKAVELYKEAEPTAETSVEIVKQIAEELGETANGVRMILSKDGCYIKSAPAAGGSATAKKDAKPATPKVGKDDKIAALANAISAAGMVPDNDILSKLTGKAADYFVTVLAGFAKSE